MESRQDRHNFNIIWIEIFRELNKDLENNLSKIAEIFTILLINEYFEIESIEDFLSLITVLPEKFYSTLIKKYDPIDSGYDIAYICKSFPQEQRLILIKNNFMQFMDDLSDTELVAVLKELNDNQRTDFLNFPEFSQFTPSKKSFFLNEVAKESLLDRSEDESEKSNEEEIIDLVKNGITTATETKLFTITDIHNYFMSALPAETPLFLYTIWTAFCLDKNKIAHDLLKLTQKIPIKIDCPFCFNQQEIQLLHLITQYGHPEQLEILLPLLKI